MSSIGEAEQPWHPGSPQSLGRRGLQELMSAFPTAGQAKDPDVGIHPVQQLPGTSGKRALSPGLGAAFRFSISLWLELLSSAPVWWTEVGHQVPERQACCLSRQAILLRPTFHLMSFCKGIK